MNKKTFLRFTAACLLIALMGVMTACNRPQKVTGVYGAGNSFYVMSNVDMPYRIDGISTTSEGNFITLDGYVNDRNGTPHDVLNAKGKRIASIRLVTEDEAFTGDSIDVDASTSGPILIVEKNISKVRLWSSTNESVQTSILVEERNTPLHITLDHININTRQRRPFLISPNNSDIILEAKGNCHIKAGEEDMTTEEYAQFSQIVTEVKELKKTWSLIKNPKLTAIVMCYSFLCCSRERLAEDPSAGSFADDFIEFNDKVFNRLKIAIDAVAGLFYGEEGAPGMDGIPAILSIGGIEVKGSGHLDILGGNGGDGFDGMHALTAGNGGDGGNSGFAVVAQTVIDAAGIADFESGDPGIGGDGGMGIYPGKNGHSGLKMDSVNAKHFFSLT